MAITAFERLPGGRVNRRALPLHLDWRRESSERLLPGARRASNCKNSSTGRRLLMLRHGLSVIQYQWIAEGVTATMFDGRWWCVPCRQRT